MHAAKALSDSAFDLVDRGCASRRIDTGEGDEPIGVRLTELGEMIVGHAGAGHVAAGQHADHIALAHPLHTILERRLGQRLDESRFVLGPPQGSGSGLPPQTMVRGRGRTRELGRGHTEPEVDNGRSHVSRCPPSVRMVSPLTYDDSGEARNSATRAISSGSHSRPTGLRARYAFLMSERSTPGRSAHAAAAPMAPSLSTAPGAMAFTRIRNGANSSASDFVSMTTAPFDAA